MDGVGVNRESDTVGSFWYSYSLPPGISMVLLSGEVTPKKETLVVLFIINQRKSQSYSEDLHMSIGVMKD